MKKILISTLVLLVVSQLQARENPFIRTDLYNEEVSRIMEEQEKQDKELVQWQEEQYIKQFEKRKNKVKKPKMPTVEKPKKKKEKLYSQKEVKKLIKKAQVQSERKVNNLIKKELKKVKPQQIVYVKPRADVLEEKDKELKRKKILSFLSITYDDDKIMLQTKYKVLKKFEIENENKIVIDYKAKKNFYTKREDLDSKNFKKIAVGTHKKHKYFRVVLKVAKKPDSYKITYNKKGLLTIAQ